MIQLRNFWVAMAIVGAVYSRPAVAQNGDGSKSLTHVVSVTIGPRVKVKVSALSLVSSRSVPAAVKVTAAQASTNGLALTVHANQAWVLSIKSAAVDPSPGSKIQWSGSAAGRFTAITVADTLLATGTPSPSPVDTTVFFRDARKSGASTTADQAVVLTISAP